MKKFIETLKNIWKIEDLRSRILLTLAFVAIYRLGSFVVLPGINPGMLDQLQSQTQGGLMSLLDMFSGGAFSNASIFALGIMPYISASIVMQLLAVAVPYFQKMQREGESGRKKISMYTRYLTVTILLFQAPSYLINLKMQSGAALATGISWTAFTITSTLILAAGSMFILWLGERITDKGIGNGISLIIMIGIIARLPEAFIQELASRFTALTGGGLFMFLVEILASLMPFRWMVCNRWRMVSMGSVRTGFSPPLTQKAQVLKQPRVVSNCTKGLFQLKKSLSSGGVSWSKASTRANPLS